MNCNCKYGEYNVAGEWVLKKEMYTSWLKMDKNRAVKMRNAR